MRSDQVATEWRNRFLAVVEDLGPAPILLSGGTDSGTILAAQLALGWRPDLWSFRFEFVPSRDWIVSDLMATHYGLTFHTVEIANSEIRSDVERLIELTGESKKSHVQCGHPIMRIAEILGGFFWTRTAYVGTGGVIEDNRRGSEILHYDGEEAFREYRRENLLKWEEQRTATWRMIDVAATFGVELLQPFATQPFADYSLSLDSDEINSPKQKGIALRAFPEFWSNGWYRRNEFLQKGSGLSAAHDAVLLGDPDLDPDGRWKSVTGIYNEIRRRQERNHVAP